MKLAEHRCDTTTCNKQPLCYTATTMAVRGQTPTGQWRNNGKNAHTTSTVESTHNLGKKEWIYIFTCKPHRMIMGWKF